MSPVIVLLVDTAGGRSFLALARRAIAAALDAAPAGSRFALVGVSDCLSLLDLTGAARRKQQH